MVPKFSGVNSAIRGVRRPVRSPGVRAFDAGRANPRQSQSPVEGSTGLMYNVLKMVNLYEQMGPGGVEPPTSRLSGVRSNHLSYEPSGDQPFRRSIQSLET
jgi:hypothetical protein